MKPFLLQNHYEVLEVSPDALPLEIRRAYKKAVALYEDNAIASYSFFSRGERREILACIEKAYLTLINAETRGTYDRHLTALGILGDRKDEREKTKTPVAIYDFQRTRGYGSAPVCRRDELRSLAAQDPAVRTMLAQETLAGADLKQLRTRLKVSLEEIAHQTNIRIDVLRAVEEENRDLLPPQVYLKGFLKAYARCLALDEQLVVSAYLRNIEKADASTPERC
ncbi:MAG: helix-turn-helix domain-containing protein [Deltaproteobacteria bacterium]|nr:helix-turn-helix domain-containing protein [Deltaproteobacteria bacterium]